MSKKLADIEQFTLNISKLWEKDWIGAIDMATGAQKELLVCQARAANLLKNITDQQATFEKLAWLTIWTKTFAIIDVDLKAYFDTVRHDLLLKKVAERVNDDQVMHLLKLILKAGGSRGVPQGGLCQALHNPPYAKKVIMQSTLLKCL